MKGNAIDPNVGIMFKQRGINVNATLYVALTLIRRCFTIMLIDNDSIIIILINKTILLYHISLTMIRCCFRMLYSRFYDVVLSALKTIRRRFTILH